MHKRVFVNTAWRQYLSINTLFSLDERLDYQEKLRRDRQLAIDTDTLRPTDNRNIKQQQLSAWIEANISHLGENSKALIDNYLSALSMAHWCAIILAMIAGVSVAGGLFFYNGNAPINVVNFLWIAVFLQWFFIVFLLLSMLPERIKKYIWGINQLAQFIAKCNLGKWLYHITSWLLEQKQSSTSNGSTSTATISENTHEDESVSLIIPAKAIVQWQIMVWSQWFAFIFNIVLLLTAVYLVVFSDLAFGWSSTLNLPPSALQSITDFLSTPWQHLWPEAVPSSALIENSRYFRALSGSYGGQTSVDVMALGQWWPFMLASIICYGLLPRCILLIFSRVMLNRALLSASFNSSASTLLLQRMNAEHIQTQALNKPEMGSGNAVDHNAHNNNAVTFQSGISLSSLADNPALYHWLDKVCPSANYWKMLAVDNAKADTEITEIGMQGVSDVIDKKSIAKNATVVLMVKSWEPPTLSFIDWLVLSSKQHGIKILPYGVTVVAGETELTQASPSDLSVWQNKLISNKLSDVEIIYMKDATHEQ